MKRILALTIVSLLWAGDALAVDNTLLITPCASSCITTKSKDIGAGVQAPQPILSDTSGNPLSTPTAGADAVSNTATGLLGYSRNLVFNGTTWDRWMGDLTNGAWVNVKTSVLPTLAATSTKQSDGTQKTQVVDGSGNVQPSGDAVARAIFEKITDGTNTMAVKAASTAAAAADPSGVTNESPNSQLSVAIGTTTDAVGSTPSTGSAATLIALAKAINNNVSSPIPAGTNLIGDVNVRQGGTALSATNPSFARPTDGTNARVFDPCEVVAHVTTPISINTAATSVIVAGTSAKKTYICSMMLFAAGTTNVGIVQGSGSTCGTSTLGLIGGATAATGPNLTAQAGFVAGNGNFAIAGTTVNANDTCLINSAAIQVSGYIVTATP